MTGARFQPLRPDGRSRGEVVFDAAVAVEPGAILSYRELRQLLELDDPPDLTVIRGAIYAGNRKLRREAHRSLEAVPRVGYRVLTAREHAAQARGYQRKARRQIGRSLEVVKATDVAQLDDNERRIHDSVALLGQALVGALRYVDGRFREHTAAIERLEDHAAATHERLRIVEAGLRAAGVAIPETVDAETVDTDDTGDE